MQLHLGSNVTKISPGRLSRPSLVPISRKVFQKVSPRIFVADIVRCRVHETEDVLRGCSMRDSMNGSSQVVKILHYLHCLSSRFCENDISEWGERDLLI